MKTFFIYVLTDPAQPKVIRYVGQTINLRLRWVSHCACPNISNVDAWISAIKILGRRPTMHLLDIVYGDVRDATIRERNWVEKLDQEHRLMNSYSMDKWCRDRRVSTGQWFSHRLNILSLMDILKPAFDNVRFDIWPLRMRMARAIDCTDAAHRRIRFATKRDSFQKRVGELWNSHERLNDEKTKKLSSR